MRGSESGYQVATQSCSIQIKCQVLDCFDRGHHLSSAATTATATCGQGCGRPQAAAFLDFPISDFSPFVQFVTTTTTHPSTNESSQTLYNSSSLCDSMTPPAPLSFVGLSEPKEVLFLKIIFFYSGVGCRAGAPNCPSLQFQGKSMQSFRPPLRTCSPAIVRTDANRFYWHRVFVVL
jgi:hypothetical protein